MKTGARVVLLGHTRHCFVYNIIDKFGQTKGGNRAAGAIICLRQGYNLQFTTANASNNLPVGKAIAIRAGLPYKNLAWWVVFVL